MPARDGTAAFSDLSSGRLALGRPNRMALTIALAMTLSACAQQGAAPPIQPQAEPEIAAELPVVKLSPPEKAPEPPVRAFPIDTFYTLLVAEVAGNREQYDIAMANYYQQAEATRDPGVAARATEIARYLNARRAALRASQLWVDLEPKNPAALTTAASEMALAGRLNEALYYCERLMENGFNAPMTAIAARAAGDKATLAAVLPEYQRLLQTFPRNAELLLGTGILLHNARQLDEALRHARLSQEVDPNLVDAPLLESRVLNDLGRKDEALSLLSRMLEAYPDNHHLRLQYARFLASEDLDKARDEFAVLVERNPNDDSMIFSLAVIQFELAPDEGAEQLFQRLIEMDKHVSSANYYLGQIYENQRNLASAVQHYRKVEPGNADYLKAIQRGNRLLTAAGAHDMSHGWFNELRERHPNNGLDFYMIESEILAQHQQYDNVHSLLSKALAQFPDNGRILFARAIANQSRGNMALFEQDLRQLLEMDPDNTVALNTLGYTLADRGERLDEAFVLIERALQLKPDDPAIIDSMGWVHFRKGNYEEAIRYLRQAFDKLQDHEVAAHLGEVLWVTGEQEVAQEIWDQGLQIKPDSHIIPGVIQRLKGPNGGPTGETTADVPPPEVPDQ